MQMFGLWFYHPDYPGCVRIEPRNNQLRLSYDCPDVWSGWDDARVVGYADMVATATAMLFLAFRHQPHPNDWRYHMLDPHGIRAERDPEDLERLQVQFCRISEQQGETLQIYYEGLRTSSVRAVSYGAKSMLAFLARVLDETSTRAYWCHTQDAKQSDNGNGYNKPPKVALNLSRRDFHAMSEHANTSASYLISCITTMVLSALPAAVL
jgi:hypothetical protein